MEGREVEGSKVELSFGGEREEVVLEVETLTLLFVIGEPR
jgi:hypothetical protein